MSGLSPFKGLTGIRRTGAPPPPVGLPEIWHFDAQNSDDMTLNAGVIEQWNNIATGPSPGPDFLDQGAAAAPSFEGSMQNGLGGAFIRPGVIREMVTGSFPISQPFTTMAVFRSDPIVNGRPVFVSESASLVRNVQWFNTSLFRARNGLNLDQNFPVIQNQGTAVVGTIIVDGANSIFRVATENDFVETTGDLGVEGYDGLRLARLGPAATSINGAVHEIIVWDGILTPTEIEDQRQLMFAKWFNDFPFTLSSLNAWWDFSSFLDQTDILGIANSFNRNGINTLIQAVVIDRPPYIKAGQNGLNYAAFDGISDNLVNSNISTLDPVTIFITFRYLNPGASQIIFQSSFLGHALIFRSDTNMFRVANGGGLFIEVPFNTGWNTIGMIFNAGASEVFLNGDAPVAGAQVSSTFANPTVGADTILASFAQVDVGDIIFSNGVLPALEISNTMTYLRNKWGTQ